MALCKSTSRVYTGLLTLDYDIPPPTSAITSYAIGLKKKKKKKKKLTANGQVFAGTHMAGRLEQTAQTVNMVLNVHRNHKAY